MKIIRVILSPEAEEVYKYLNEQAPGSKTEKIILNALNNKVEFLKSNPHYGDPIAKKLIPEEYKQKYGITNLFRIELPNFWRMLYTLTNNESEIEIIAFVLDIIDHPKYNKKFGYKDR
ncbi:MAG: hypothetical protein PHC66_05130 [Candidatus Nanoarchaeia archaeon]|nr:hypothetical protein [Candidatus Nanoarchaeia archaeon]MDD5239069.1 hypothetical protein [Candidatus Nanoarchaeia archaeon]